MPRNVKNANKVVKYLTISNNCSTFGIPKQRRYRCNGKPLNNLSTLCLLTNRPRRKEQILSTQLKADLKSR